MKNVINEQTEEKWTRKVPMMDRKRENGELKCDWWIIFDQAGNKGRKQKTN